jgi:hypothetical protein
MNKDEIKDLFQNQLKELDEFEKEIKSVKRLINSVIYNFELLDSNITDEQITEVFSNLNIKSSKLNSIVKDMMSDSKKMESFLNQVKLLKIKRDAKLIEKQQMDNYAIK